MTLLLAANACAAAQFPSICSIADRLEGEVEVHHVGGYRGSSDLGAVIELDDSGHEVMKIDVLANASGKSIVLVLSAYDPVVWNVAWTAGTRIAGVVVSGSHGQAIVGIPRSIPLYLRSGNRARPANAVGADCPSFAGYEQNHEYATAAAVIEKIVGKPVTRFTSVPDNGVALIGPADASAKIEFSADYGLQEFVVRRGPDEIPPGRRGLEELAKRGYLRHATLGDIRSFEAKGARGIIRGFPIYVALKRLTMPDALGGGYAVNILVPAGVPMPDGPRGHNRFFRFGRRGCEGPGCD